jgi:hypothetical protein
MRYNPVVASERRHGIGDHVRNRSALGTALVIVVMLVAAILRSRQPPAPVPQPAQNPGATVPDTRENSPQPSSPSNSSITSSRGFRSRQQLEEHFDKHGGEFGRITIEQYLQRAQTLRDAPVGGSIVERVRPSDGVITRFDRKTGAFGAYNSDGTIRTFFKPDDGEAYFNRQIDRELQ